MTMNVGLFDRIMRLSAGLGFVLFDYISSSNWEVLFLMVGAERTNLRFRMVSLLWINGC